jgi:hypothetical protein
MYTPRGVIVGTGSPRSLVYGSLESGELRAIRRGSSGRWLIPGNAVLEWLEHLGNGEGGDATTTNGSE